MLNTNYTYPVKTLLSVAAWFMAIFAALFVVASVMLLISAWGKKYDIDNLATRVSTLEGRGGVMGGKLLDDTEHYARLKRRIDAVNAVSPIKGAGVNQFLSAIESILPNGVVVDTIRYSAADGQVVMVVSAGSYDDIYRLITQMEQSRIFTSPDVQQRPSRHGASTAIQQYEMRMSARQP